MNGNTNEIIHLPSNDGKTTLHGIIWMPPKEIEPVGVLQLVHGMVEYIERYEEFALYLNSLGYIVAGHDHLGHGKSVINEKALGYIADTEHPSEILIKDIHTVRTELTNRYNGLPYFILGHSMGSYLLRNYLTKYGSGLSGAIIMGTGKMPNSATNTALLLCRFFKLFFGEHHRSKLIKKLSYTHPYHKFDTKGHDFSNSWLTKDSAIVKKYYEDPKCTFTFTLNAYKALFETVKYDNEDSGLKKIPRTLPLFLVSGSDDPVGNLSRGVLKLYDEYKMYGILDVSYVLFENDRHEILNETDRIDKVYPAISKWLDDHR